MQNNLLEQSLLSVNSTIADAIANLDFSHLKIVLVVSDDKVLYGTITDGDIRRGLLRGLNLGSPVKNIVHQEAFVVPEDMRLELVIDLMTANKIQQIPVIDKKRRIVGLHLWDEIVTSKLIQPNLMIVMAGGEGKRLRPHSENCPKPLIEVRGKPMLEHIIDRAKLEGFEKFIFATNYLGHMIENYFGDGDRFGVKIDYLREQSALGTAGALSLLTSKPKIPFVVTNGDVITDVKYSEVIDYHEQYDASATMAVSLYEWHHPFGVVDIQGVNIVGFQEKPTIKNHINAGIYVLAPEALDVLDYDKYCDMPTLFERLHKKNKRTIAYPLHESWMDVGYPDDLKKANSEQLNFKAKKNGKN